MAAEISNSQNPGDTPVPKGKLSVHTIQIFPEATAGVKSARQKKEYRLYCRCHICIFLKYIFLFRRNIV